MSLSNEAGYLYVLSKELTRINKSIRSISKKAEKHRKKHGLTADVKKKQKHQERFEETAELLRALVKEQQEIIKKLRHHYVAFANALQKENAF